MKVNPISAVVGDELPGAAQAVLDALDCQVAVLAASGQVVVANHAWSKLAESDVPCATHVPAGRNYLQVFERDVRGEALHAAAGVHAVLARHKNHISVEYACDSCGEKAWFKIDATACNIGGAPHTVVVHRSITPGFDREALQRREADKLVERELRAQIARKDEFFAILLHELRNPLAPIANAAELLARHSADAASAREARAIIGRQVRQMTRLLEDLSDASHKCRDDFEVAPVRIDMCEPVMIAVDAARPLMELRRHSLRVDIPRDRHYVNGDTVRLAQVFTNLLTNAAKYTKPGGHVTLCARMEGGRTAVSVQDDGIGIAPEDQDLIFELFSRVRRGGNNGMGIGLAVVRKIVERHGGVIAVHSDGPGRGSVFTVFLPDAG